MAVDVEASLDKVLNDLRLFDLSIDLHGSRALGIYQPRSNVDILSTRSLQGLLEELEDPQQTKFKPVGKVVQTGPPWFMPPKLNIVHVTTGIPVDLISRWSADIFVRDRDAVCVACMHRDDRVQPYLQIVLKWAKGRQDSLPVEQGYPNTYCFRLLALHFLMTRQLGVVLPPLTAHGSFLNEEHDTYTSYKKEKNLNFDDLAMEFLDYLAKCSRQDRGIWADLRNPYETPPTGVWQVFDPPSHKKLLRLTTSQITEIGKIAKNDAPLMKRNEQSKKKEEKGGRVLN